MKVKELNEFQLQELKQNLLCEKYDRMGKTPSYWELAYVNNIIPDEEVYSSYENVNFAEEDFVSA